MSSASSSTDELLLVVVDATRGAWSALDATARGLASAPSAPSAPAAPAAGASFPEFLLALELFLAAFACSSRRSRLAVLAYNGREGGFIYPPRAGGAGAGGAAGGGAGGGGADDLLRPAVIKRLVRAGMLRLRFGGGGGGGAGTDLLAEATAAAEAAAAAAGGGADDDAVVMAPAGPATASASFSSSSSSASASASSAAAAAAAGLSLDARTCTLGSCLALALCFAGRQRREGAAAGRPLPARLCVFQASPDVPAHYISVVNAVYSALRMSVPVDSCVVGAAPSVFLQQAAYLTQGLHVAPDAAPAAAHWQNLLQFLVTLLLPSRRAREAELLLPLRRNVNLRAHCFCHRQHRSLAWLCYVCLSVWCRETEACATCGTRMSGSAAAAAADAAAAAAGGAGAGTGAGAGAGAGAGGALLGAGAFSAM